MSTSRRRTYVPLRTAGNGSAPDQVKRWVAAAVQRALLTDPVPMATAAPEVVAGPPRARAVTPMITYVTVPTDHGPRCFQVRVSEVTPERED